MNKTAPRRRTIGVGMLGHGFMGRAHSFGLRSLAAVAPTPIEPRLVAICGRDAPRVEDARRRMGFLRGLTDWRRLVEDGEVELLDNSAPNHLHAEPVFAAVAHGKPVLCEKPLAPSADEAHAMWSAAERAGVVHMCGFSLRFIPAVRRARRLLEAGELGDVTHFRGRFLASSALSGEQRRTWRFQRGTAGSGALGDLGSHIIDLAAYLVGDVVSVAASMRTFVQERDGEPVDVDDAVAVVVEFASGALGTVEASRAAGRRSNTCSFEIDGTRGSLGFDIDRLNQLELCRDRKQTVTIDVTHPNDPFMEFWWPAPGHAVGWGDSFTHEMHHFVAAVAGDRSIAPDGADFGDGYRCAEVCDAIGRAATSGQREAVVFRPVMAERAVTATES